MAVKRRGKRGILADALHKLVEERHPHGLPLGTAAQSLYGSDTKNHRERIYRLAGALRKNNIMVFSFGGRYHLCNEDIIRLFEVAMHRQAMAASAMQNAYLYKQKALELGLPAEKRKKLESSFKQLKKMVVGLG